MNDPIKILLVEDSPDDVRLTQEALRDAGIPTELYVTEDGDEALDFLFRRKEYSSAPIPDLVLLDLNLPRLCGHEVLLAIAPMEEFKEIPVVLLTVSQSEDDIAMALNNGMTYYMRKPIEPERLSSVLEAISMNTRNEKFNSAVYRVIAGNPQTPQHILAMLAHHSNAAVRKYVAENPKLDFGLLAEMAHDQSSDVRLSVAYNPSVSIDILSLLANDENPDVRYGIAERIESPAEILSQLCQDENPYVASTAKETIKQLMSK